MSLSTFALVCVAILVLVLWAFIRIQSGIIRSQCNDLKTLKDQKALEDARPDHERQLLAEGLDDSWMKENPRDIAKSAGNVVLLIWLLRTEKKYRDFRGRANDQYPPDWKWRKAFVLSRDSFKCMECGIGTGEGLPLDCHHKIPISKWPQDERGMHDLSNLVTLCPKCHAERHPENAQMQERAKRLQARAVRWREYCSRRNPRRVRLSIHTWAPTISLEDLVRRSPQAGDDTTSAGLPIGKTPGDESRYPKLSPEEREASIREFEEIRAMEQPDGESAEVPSQPDPAKASLAEQAAASMNAWGEKLKNDPHAQVPY